MPNQSRTGSLDIKMVTNYLGALVASGGATAADIQPLQRYLAAAEGAGVGQLAPLRLEQLDGRITEVGVASVADAETLRNYIAARVAAAYGQQVPVRLHRANGSYRDVHVQSQAQADAIVDAIGEYRNTARGTAMPVCIERVDGSTVTVHVASQAEVNELVDVFRELQGVPIMLGSTRITVGSKAQRESLLDFLATSGGRRVTVAELREAAARKAAENLTA